ncbi:11-beta-hydroxysteroid dehydrogenase 1B isoform X2 [Neltuma alba]|uniref:11-beta-hydroxysteroid dehydrogenase 1B isoform X2 n=1 Tax=Neltuma alba TaxID=207710 RepID=UPI0010A2C927|nr:11-beta-hydroxysteroid dehydrogenase 1B-like isoform X2 [Prosopis alba]
MDLIQKLLNITLIPSTFFALLLLVPPFYVLKFLSSLFKSCLNHESVAGKVALITGASSGIGEELAYEYARRGARLALVARREDRLRSVLDKALQLGSPDAMIIPADVSNIEDSQRFVAQTVNHFGQFPHLRKSRGKIVVISSAAAWCLPPRMSFYNASKAATISFFETLRAEFGPDIGITIVTPGFTKTEMTSDQLLEQMGVKTLPFAVPLESAERCAKAIVKSTCRGDMYLIEPSWTRTLMWLKWFLAAPVDWCFRFLLGKHRVIH